MPIPKGFSPHREFGGKFLENDDPAPDRRSPVIIAEFTGFQVTVYADKVVLHHERIYGMQQEQEITLSFREPVSVMLKDASLLKSGWITFVTPSYGVDHANLGCPLSRGEMKRAAYLASAVEHFSDKFASGS